MPIMSKYQRAAQLWALLGLAARNRQILTYNMVAGLVGVPAQGLGRLLDPVHEYCRQEGLPPLTILVVGDTTGVPGSGFFAVSAEEFAKSQLDVFDHDWIGQGAPTPEEMKAAVSARASDRPT